MTDKPQTPAGRVIEKCGGVAALAEMAGVHVSRVYSWTHEKSERGGTGGIIPSRKIKKIIEAAAKKNIVLTLADFFDTPARAA